MFNKLATCIMVICLAACGNNSGIEPTPLVMSVRFEIPSSNARDIEKYFIKPLTKALGSAAHVSATHPIALTNGATLIVFFEDGIKFAEGEDIINAVIAAVKSPKKPSSVNFTEMCGDDLSQSDLMHIAKAKGIKPENVFDNVITVTGDLGKNILPPDEYNSMFQNKCDEPAQVPLSVLEN
jgi:hypothetical protein